MKSLMLGFQELKGMRLVYRVKLLTNDTVSEQSAKQDRWRDFLDNLEARTLFLEEMRTESYLHRLQALYTVSLYQRWQILSAFSDTAPNKNVVCFGVTLKVIVCSLW